MRRYVETNRWDDSWYSNLSIWTQRALDYMRDSCDHAGVWETNFRKAEFSMGVHKIAPRYSHPSLVGIEYTSHAAAVEDVEGRNLDPSKIIPVPVIVWKQVFQELNTPVQQEMEFDDAAKPDSPIQVQVIAGGKKWWLVKFIKFQYGARDGGLTLDENLSVHIPVMRSLRVNGLLDSFKSFYPNALVVSKGDEKPKRLKYPTLEEVLEAPEGEGLPEANKRQFFARNETKNWKGIHNWRSALTDWKIGFEKMQEAGKVGIKAWPATINEKRYRLEEIGDRMLELGAPKNRYMPEGGTTKIMKPECAEEFKLLGKIKDKLEREIREGGGE